MTSLARLYGLTVRSELPLHQHRPPPDPNAIDLTITLGEPILQTDELPPSKRLLHLKVDKQYFTAGRTEDGFLLRFFGTCDVRFDPALTSAVVHPVSGTDPALLAVLAGGTLLAFALSMRGEPVLHASAVQIGGSALAFVGSSGMGKSTTATLMCADGALLITDDLLRLNLARTPPTCSLGATELRLRKAAGDLSDRFARTPGRRITGDAREALAMPASTTENLPLAAIVVPLPDRSEERTEPEVERLDTMAAFLLLSRFPRLLGWEDEDVLRQQFQQLGEVVDTVPVYLAHLPWGPPFPENLAARLRKRVGLG